MKNKYLKSRLLVVTTIVSILIVSMFASEKPVLTNVFMNEQEMNVNILEHKSTYTLPVIAFLKQIDPEQKNFQYEGNMSSAMVKVGTTEYRFYKFRPYYYSGTNRILYSTETQDGIIIPGNFRAYGANGEINIPFNTLMSILKIPFTYNNGILSFTFNKQEPVVIPAPTGLDERGRQVFTPEKDDVSTPAGLKAFQTTYNLGGFVTSDKVPTKYDINPNYYENYVDKMLWGREEFEAYNNNPPELIGKDGSKAPYTATSDVFFKWLNTNDPYLSFEQTKTSFHGDSPTTTAKELESKGYLYGYLGGYIQLYTSKVDDIHVVDTEKDPYVKYDEDVIITVRALTPDNAVYTKMLMRHYLGDVHGPNAYKLFVSGWTKGDTKLLHGYQFGDRQVIFIKVAGGVSIKISEPGFKYTDFFNMSPDYHYVPKKYHENPFSSGYKPY